MLLYKRDVWGFWEWDKLRVSQDSGYCERQEGICVKGSLGFSLGFRCDLVLETQIVSFILYWFLVLVEVLDHASSPVDVENLAKSC